MTRPWPLAVSLAAAWLLISIAPLLNYLGRGRATLSIVLAMAAIPAGMIALARQIRDRKQIHAAWLAVPFGLLIDAFAVLYPRSLRIAANSGKLRYLPSALHPQQTLPILGLLVACAGCVFLRKRMDLPRVFLIFSASMLVIIAPPIAGLMWPERRIPYELSYLSMGVLPFALWALARYEQVFQKEKTDPLGRAGSAGEPANKRWDSAVVL